MCPYPLFSVARSGLWLSAILRIADILYLNYLHLHVE
jgi:hypothetical protein